MNNHNTQFLDEQLTSICPEKISVAIIFESVADGIRAKLFSDQVIARATDGPGGAVNLNLWSFKVLGIPEILYLASIATATADLVIISVADTKTLPWQFQNWITMWSDLVKGRHPFMVALFANPVNGNTRFRDELQKAATRTGIQLYTRTDHEEDWIYSRQKRPDAWVVESGGTPLATADDRVLVVDDDHYSCVLAGKILELLGLHADFASNGAEAVNAFFPGVYSAILMDVTMPVMDGLDATKKIREIEAVAGGHVPIIAMTANVMAGDRELCLAAGMDEFLSKPFHKDDLVAKLHWSQHCWFECNGQKKSNRYLEEVI